MAINGLNGSYTSTIPLYAGGDVANLTLCAWVRTDASSSSGQPLVIPNCWSLNVYGQTSAEFVVNGRAGYLSAYNYSIPPKGTLAFYVGRARWDVSSNTLYTQMIVNGNTDGATVYSIGAYGIAFDVTGVSVKTADSVGKGNDLADVRVYHSYLSDAEVKAIYYGMGTDSVTRGLLARWKLFGQVGTSPSFLKDSVGSVHLYGSNSAYVNSPLRYAAAPRVGIY